MKHLWNLAVLVFISIVIMASGAVAAESPLTMVRTLVEQILATLRNPTYQGAARQAERFERVRQLVLPHVDSQEIAKRALGPHWRDRTEDEREEFSQLFTDLVEKSYRRTLDRYAHEMQIVYDPERIDNSFAEVETKALSSAQSEPLTITYRLHLRGGQWFIYDMVIANVSLVRNYRTQFDRILTGSSYAELIKNIKHKLQELDDASSSILPK
jgi:phospholipid transport system substrate-binding protein